MKNLILTTVLLLAFTTTASAIDGWPSSNRNNKGFNYKKLHKKHKKIKRNNFLFNNNNCKNTKYN